MGLKEGIEKLGYCLWLRWDEGIQYEFNQQKQKIESNTYLAKAVLLGKLIFEIKVLKKSPHDKWLKKQRHLKYPEWENQDNTEWKYAGEYDGKEQILLDLWNVTAWQLFENVDLQEKFLCSVLDLPERRYLKKCDPKLVEEAWKKLLSFSIVNQEIKELILTAAEQGKKIILIDQFDLPEKAVRQWLMGCGFPTGVCVIGEKEFSGARIWKGRMDYVACTTEKGEHNLTDYITFPDIREQGKYYRIYSGYNPVISAYNTLMNVKFHWEARMEKINYFYGIGYKYGGILVSGICQWLNAARRQEKIDKIVFLSRDCDVICQVYRKWFNEMENEYLYISRRAVLEAVFQDFPEEYVKNVLISKITYEETVTIEEAFEDLEIGFLLNYLEAVGLQKDQRLDLSVIENINNLVRLQYEVLSQHFAKRRQAALKYLKEKFSGCKKVCVLDLGWKGTTITCLSFLQRQQNWDCQIQGALVAAMDDAYVANNISKHKILTFLFSNERVQRLKRRTGIPYNNMQVKCFETILSSPERTLTNYELDENNQVSLRFRDENINADAIRMIHRGILDFQESFVPFIQAYGLNISSEDAFLALSGFLDTKPLVEMFIEQLKKDGRKV